MRIVSYIFLALVSVASARLGENLEQLTARYGKPVSHDGDGTIFSKAGYRVIAMLFKGKCGALTFSKSDGAEMKPIEISALLSANDGGGGGLSRKIPLLGK